MKTLYIVATPIGNLQDITLRAADILLSTPVIVAESTSKAGILLEFLEKYFNRKRLTGQKIISLTQEEEENKMSLIVQIVEQNNVALISEAGTPLISDPGFRIVREAIKRDIKIVPVPGSSSPIAALSASGLPTDKFIFLGFLPKSQAKRKKLLIQSKDSKSTVIFFESPHRTNETLKDLINALGDIDIVVARELTKIHEEIIRNKAGKILKRFEQKPPRGELTVLFSAKS
ncbi:MAG: 16S rRNA (cytidine(1402)-2'-O)-methyltransferase [Candidatus Levybacteria bacterium RIFCSPHIGHO2_02_FULL_39_36]|nr:MAG: 16S rRNA (cytidine(1402)-2'-O)-methyltransferase [Candidatus Levybacteria bacterium RIFCSPHIGHO2_01_FULL_38_96]OGH25405.1 MAG: 16S rRNA (cytidine(1402)-2'-O)-methyltransferase [Candidatus Levybacteria bacterium RIFCSPHIGHO2_12_FULL_39_39]OGH27343.1 MAG: 16S rRNA (cytidine(1402)-2'-O)-methyltransferase [Candidatus Levybacteria bacterium RIFCSPHIGHO2_02_FULL_39_36]OGH36375.1 MAG: 16S rRNA (cytidine(1402)-2'-O)-methyltransferase [Candidatus Levybacteria bacterium RIFCSPLOWO2_01_FULL_38_120]